MSLRPDSAHRTDSARGTDPTRTIALPRRGGLALILAFTTAVAIVPASQALASSHGTVAVAVKTAASTALAASRGGRGIAEDGGQRGSGSRGGRSGTETIPPANPRSDHSWWPFGAALHGVEIVESRDGSVQTVTFQRGIVQAISSTSVTVLSRDGITQTWTLDSASSIRVREHRTDVSKVKLGSYVGVWGAGTATTPTAKVVVVAWSPKVAPPANPLAGPSVSPSATPSQSPSASPSATPSASGS